MADQSLRSSASQIEHRDCDEDDPFGCICDDCAVRDLSLGWEAKTGADSIDTIERVYSRSRGGAYICIWPGCTFSRRDPVALWRHVHLHNGGSLPPDDFDPGPWL